MFNCPVFSLRRHAPGDGRVPLPWRAGLHDCHGIPGKSYPVSLHHRCLGALDIWWDGLAMVESWLYGAMGYIINYHHHYHIIYPLIRSDLELRLGPPNGRNF